MTAGTIRIVCQFLCGLTWHLASKSLAWKQTPNKLCFRHIVIHSVNLMDAWLGLLRANSTSPCSNRVLMVEEGSLREGEQELKEGSHFAVWITTYDDSMITLLSVLKDWSVESLSLTNKDHETCHQATHMDSKKIHYNLSPELSQCQTTLLHCLLEIPFRLADKYFPAIRCNQANVNRPMLMSHLPVSCSWLVKCSDVFESYLCCHSVVSSEGQLKRDLGYA